MFKPSDKFTKNMKLDAFHNISKESKKPSTLFFVVVEKIKTLSFDSYRSP